MPNAQASTRAARWAASCAAAVMLGAAAQEPAPQELRLSQLLEDTRKSLGVLQAEAEYRVAKHQLEREQAKDGWKLAGSVGAGRIYDLIDDQKVRDYPAIQAKVGASYPLLGSFEKNGRDVEEATGIRDTKRVRLQVSLRTGQLDVESAYARYWAAQEALEAVAAYLAAGEALGPSDGDLRGGFERARTERARLRRLQDEARSEIGAIVGRDLAPFQARLVGLPAVSSLKAEDLADGHPDLAELRAQKAALDAMLAKSDWYGSEADVDVSASSLQDMDSKQRGETYLLTLNVSVPLGFFTLRQAEKDRLRAEVDATRLAYDLRRADILPKVRAAQEAYAEQSKAVAAARQRRESAAKSLRERFPGGRLDEADGAAKHLASFYKIALDEMEAREKAWLAHVELRRQSPAGPVGEPAESEVPDVGSALAEPMAALARGARGREGARSGAAPIEVAAVELAGPGDEDDFHCELEEPSAQPY